MPSRLVPLGAAIPLLALLACSPDDHATAPASAEGLPFSAGDLSGFTLGPVGQATITNSDSALVTGIPGEFTRLSYRTPDSARVGTYIYFTLRTGLQSHIYRMGLNGRGLQQLTTDPLGARLPSVSPDGRQILYFQNLPTQSSTPYFTAILMEHDGRGKHSVFTEASVRSPAAWSPVGDTVTVSNGDDDPGQQGLYVHPLVSGALARRLTDGPDVDPTRGVVHGEPSVVYSDGQGLWRVNVTTGDTAYYFSLSSLGIAGSVIQPQISPDSKRILFWTQDPSGFLSLYYSDIDSPNLLHLVVDVDRSPSSPFMPYADWLPDGHGFVVSLPSASNPDEYQLYQVDTLGGQRLITTLTRPLENGFTVGPAAVGVNRDLIGPGAALAERASGILFGQSRGHIIASVLAVGAADPASLTMEAETGLNSTAPFLTVNVTADRITSLRYLNALEGPVTTVADSTSPNVGGALVTFNANDGTVALVLIYGGEGAPSFQDNGTVRIFTTPDSVVRLDGRAGQVEGR